ncbi:MAG: outer membrane lipoprotein carrier protein LolA [Deltaproteobacteria bacterium]|nr:outer membrane lipoprotein carrier protein LolA [Deltaproteobacteria bacterium]
MSSLIAICTVLFTAPPELPVAAAPASTPASASAKKPAAAKPAEPVARGPERAVLDRVQRFYEKTTDLRADFIQRYTRVALSKTSESKGRVSLKKPGMMRWDYETPVEKHFITDGQKLYVYEPEDEQVIVDQSFKSSAMSSSLAFLFGQGRLEDSFTAKLLDPKAVEAKPGFDVLELTPKKDATYAKLVLVTDPKTGQVLESILFETAGNLNRFEFVGTKTNVGIPDADFSFQPPKGVEVVTQ